MREQIAENAGLDPSQHSAPETADCAATAVADTGLPDDPAAQADEMLPMIEELRARVSEILAQENELATRERELARRAEDLAVREAETAEQRRALEARQSRGRMPEEVARRLASIVQRSRDLASGVRHAAEADSHVRPAAEHPPAAKAGEPHAYVEHDSLRMTAALGELQERQAALDALAEELAQRQNALSGAEAKLRQDWHSLEALIAEHDVQRAADQAERKEIARERAALDALRVSLEQRGAAGAGDGDHKAGKLREMALEQRERDLEARDAESRARDAQVAEQLEQITQRERELLAKRASVDKLYLQAIETKQRALQQLETVQALKREIEEKDSQLRDANLQAAVERDQLNELRAELERRRSESPAPARAAAAGARPARSPWPRITAVAFALGLSAGGAWWQVETPHDEGIARLRVSTARNPAAGAFAEHAAALSNSAELTPPGAHLIASQLADDGALTLHWSAPVDAAALGAAVDRYNAQVASWPIERWLTPTVIARRDELAKLDTQIEELDARRTAILARRDSQPAFAEWDVARAKLDETRAMIDALGRALVDARATLRSAESVDDPHGFVTPEAVSAAIAQDAVYQEDLKELGSEWRKYREELAVALVLVEEPTKVLRGAIREMHDALTEQAGLQPSPAVQKVLQETTQRIDELDTQIAEFAQAWEKRRMNVERGEAAEDTALELVTHQTEATEASRRITSEVRGTVDLLNKSALKLGETGDSSTREVVVAALLRSNLNAISQKLDAVVEKAAATDPLTNFKLDAHDRQLRGLRTRLQNRQGAIREELQQQYDELARTDRKGTIEKANQRIATLEQQRDAMTLQVVDDVTRLRSVESQADALRRIQLELAEVESQIDAAAERRCELAAGDDAPPIVDSVALVDTERLTVGAEHRPQHAAVAGVSAFVLTLLVSGLAVAGRRP